MTRREAFGYFVDFGEEAEGVVNVTRMVDDPAETDLVMPPLGATVDAALFFYSPLNDQPQLSTRPQDLSACR